MSSEKYHIASFEQAKEIMNSGVPFALIDVRTDEEYIVEHAKGAVLLPLDDITPNTAKTVIPDADTVILLYCRSGRRSKLAADKLIKYGYDKIYDIGSLAGWPYGREYGI